jgi:pimeloyl-[acyl-carrier protein] methyl ester esterase
MPYIKSLSGISWHYLLKGEADSSLLFMHGWAGEANIWYRQLDYFSKRFQTVALDLPGHGKSSWHDIDFSSLVADIDFIIRKLKLNNLVILGLSFSGQIALELALRPSLVKKLVLVDTTPRFVKDKGFEAGLSIKQISKLSRQLDTDFPNILTVFARSLFTEEERKKDMFVSIWELLSKRRNFPSKYALKRMLDMVAQIDLREKLSEIKVPSLIICGQRDSICPLYASRFLNEHIANSTLQVIPDCGHMPFLTEEEKFNSIIDAFLR